MPLIVQWIPLVNVLSWFEWRIHRSVLLKFFALWFLSVFPLLLAGFAAELNSEQNVVGIYLSRVTAEFRATSLFVYSITFLLPMLYLTYERLYQLGMHAFSGRRAPSTLHMPDGMHFVLFVAVIVFLFTAFAYGTSSKGAATPGQVTLLEAMLRHGLIVWVVYVYAIFCWYVTMLLESSAQSGFAFVEAARESEQSVTAGLGQRVQGGGNE